MNIAGADHLVFVTYLNKLLLHAYQNRPHPGVAPHGYVKWARFHQNPASVDEINVSNNMNSLPEFDWQTIVGPNNAHNNNVAKPVPNPERNERSRMAGSFQGTHRPLRPQLPIVHSHTTVAEVVGDGVEDITEINSGASEPYLNDPTGCIPAIDIICSFIANMFNGDPNTISASQVDSNSQAVPGPGPSTVANTNAAALKTADKALEDDIYMEESNTDKEHEKE
ncbi:hypothetical protein M422DRAFT_268957 [Sphaerobolus stellatus SS14]|uniref:Uncharacterized protein n=1 Tax=Sphaerobolus stellatus (strain SS14) TaxID=990650 RepID=A0A0C9TJ36_SPHS4|nr:hypothetical protein M422DRAFT_268957 [Sphaerobolus stellatus SS14]